MESRRQNRQPEQPPKQAAYAQASNPVSQTPQEQRTPAQPTRQYGDSISSITRRTVESRPSSEEAQARLNEQRQKDQQSLKNISNVDLEYGVEQQPAEGYIADTVERKGMGMQRAQEGAHAGPVGSAAGPGHPGFGEERDLAAQMGRKRAEHDRVLGERVGQSPAEPDRETAERDAVRQRKLMQNRNLDVGATVKEATGEPVVGS
ncbi:hypothetical protein NUU61_006005 [Penicillium alfredii]|uniref:Uncharacterized protein n=1 Tax=Penicillium alfredii TaxID=1506179 RepID=A0A9W9F096_9EURO|nr:uncharacterized protein NUU61_006005 [Penicillium alfredii]KAJ5091135.1 hypothetical protein NUU61_006005 [Penicillium alfredii]